MMTMESPNVDIPATVAADDHVPAFWRAVTLLRSLVLGLLISVAFIPIILACRYFLHLHDPGVLFLIGVVIAAKYGDLPTGLATIGGTLVGSFVLFYHPFYALNFDSKYDIWDLFLYTAVALVAFWLASTARSNATVAKHSSRELELLYAFSRQLARATRPDEVCQAVQQNASSLLGAPAFVMTQQAAGSVPTRLWTGEGPPAFVRAAAEELGKVTPPFPTTTLTDPASNQDWLVQIVSHGKFGQGMVMINLGPHPSTNLTAIRQKVGSLLENAGATFERLELSTAVIDAAMHSKAEELREAIIGSVSHGLRTPLASILGSATILADRPAVVSDPQAVSLAGIVVSEARRLNDDIQKLLDAATVSSKGLRPTLTWIEAADLINAALAAQHSDGRATTLSIPQNVPLVQADPALIVQALRLIIDNARKYSPATGGIRLAVINKAAEIVISIEDDGIGMSPMEMLRAFDRFFRGANVRDTTRGSGLGLWIAHAFVTACGGRLELAPARSGPGLCVSVILPCATQDQMRLLESSNE